MKPQPVTTSTRTESVRRPQKSTLRRLIPYVIAATLAAAIIYGFLPKPVDVETAAVSVGSLTVSVLEEGKTRIRHRYVVSAPVTGFLQRVELRAGAAIEMGKTVLATVQPQPASFLDPRSQAEAEARLKAAEAGVMRAQAELERFQEGLAMAEKERTRAAELKKKGAVSEKEFDLAENQAAMLGRDVRAAEFALRVAEFTRTQAEATLLQTQSPAAAQAEPLTIVAPVNGFVLNVFEESARIVIPGTPVMEVGDPADLECEIELLSSDAVAVQPGADVSIEQWGGERPLRGKVALIEPGGYTKISALGVEEQRVKVRVNFAEPIPPEHPLGDRYRVEARIITWHSDRVPQIPTGAIFRRGGDWMTFVVESGKARLRKVEIAHNNGVAAEVRAGVTEGQSVVLHPSDSVVDGASVRPRQSER
ncbi:MAG TPA: HlyD family efflux transporter periplasmic adaptor subunit [Chthoniobacteraceae bacterium]|nr:HlyD family efflux transporter periplasmic adaptor subunit [Chthoniobacteraceae bacterium]